MPPSKAQLQNRIEQLEQELGSFKKQLNSYSETPTLEEANVGDTLEDGCIVVQKSNGLALLVAPQSTEIGASWSKDFPGVFAKLKDEGFNPSHFFIPTKEQLRLAYSTIPQKLSSTSYWSSTEDNANFSYYVDFSCNGNSVSYFKSNVRCVRAFRCVSYGD